MIVVWDFHFSARSEHFLIKINETFLVYRERKNFVVSLNFSTSKIRLKIFFIATALVGNIIVPFAGEIIGPRL